MSSRRLLAAVLALSVVGCGGTVTAPDVNPTPQDNKAGPGLFSGESGNLLDAFRDKGGKGAAVGLGVNGYLWRAALEAVSFMPVTQADPVGGVILTDWYVNPEKTHERVKMNVYLLGKTLQAQAVRVAVFKQQLKDDEWVNVPVDAGTASALEETILTNARALRVRDKQKVR